MEQSSLDYALMYEASHHDTEPIMIRGHHDTEQSSREGAPIIARLHAQRPHPLADLPRVHRRGVEVELVRGNTRAIRPQCQQPEALQTCADKKYRVRRVSTGSE